MPGGAANSLCSDLEVPEAAETSARLALPSAIQTRGLPSKDARTQGGTGKSGATRKIPARSEDFRLMKGGVISRHAEGLVAFHPPILEAHPPFGAFGDGYVVRDEEDRLGPVRGDPRRSP